MELNHVFDPLEDARRPGYTKDGAWAGTNSVLGWGTWSAGATRGRTRRSG